MARTLPIAGIDVLRIGLGTNRLTPDNADFLRAAVEAGVNHIDTAHLYTGGESERAIGDALGARDDLVIATKGGFRDGSPAALRSEIEQSLASLQTEVIALYYLHRVDSATPLETSLETIVEYVDRGAIRAVGISEVTVAQIKAAREVVPIAAVQNLYNLDDRGHDDVIDYCEAEGIAFVPFYPLRGGGSLTNTEKLTQLLDRSPVVLPIPGTRSIEHLRENLTALA